MHPPKLWVFPIHSPNHHMAFAGRTVAVVNDLSVDEQLYVYEQTRCDVVLIIARKFFLEEALAFFPVPQLMNGIAVGANISKCN